MRRQEFSWPWRNDFETARRKTGERRRCPRRHREWASSELDHDGVGPKDWDLLPAAESKVMAVTHSTAASTQEKILRARAASARMAQLSTKEKNALLLAIADAIEANESAILAANREDVENSGLDGAMRDRLLLTPSRIKDMAGGVREVAALPDPVGETLAVWTKSNGLLIRKVRVPLGVVGIIYESRPNVTVDTAVLTLKTGNAIVLRG